MSKAEFDLVIIGGGLVGASLAAALRDTEIRIAVVEPYEIDSHSQPSFDGRTIALTYHGRQFYEEIGLWHSIENQGVEPIRDIHISDRGHFGVTHLSHTDVGTPALGYVIPTRVIGHALFKSLKSSTNVRLMQPATAKSMRKETEYCDIVVKWDGSEEEVRAKLTVIADGGRSQLIPNQARLHQPYEQQAILSIVQVDRPHRGRGL